MKFKNPWLNNKLEKERKELDKSMATINDNMVYDLTSVTTTGNVWGQTLYPSTGYNTGTIGSNYPYPTVTTTLQIVPTAFQFTYHPEQPQMYRWGGQVFLHPSPKLRMLCAALQLL